MGKVFDAEAHLRALTENPQQFFDARQPRDKDGQFASKGGGASAAAAAPPVTGQPNDPAERTKLDAMHTHFTQRRNDVYDAARNTTGYTQAHDDKRAELTGKHQAYVHAANATQGSYVGGMASVMDDLQRGHDSAKNSADRFNTPTDRGRHQGYKEIMAHMKAHS